MQTTISSTDDLVIGVINHGPVEPTWFYANKAYIYVVRGPNNKTAITPVPWVVAQHHFGLGIKQDDRGNIRVVRKDWKEDHERDSLVESRLASVCPKKFSKPNPDEPGHYIDDPEIKDWFLNKVQFKARVRKTLMNEEEFMAG